LAGKAMGVPVYQLLGGRVRTKIPVYFDVSPARAAEVIRTTGINLVKTPVGGITRASNDAHGFDPGRWAGWRITNHQLDEVVSYVASFRKAIGPKPGMAIEFHTVYDLESAIMIAKGIERYQPAWIEEPIPSDNPDAMAEVRRASPVPIACGENVYTRYGFRPFFEKQAISIAQPDIGKTGGLLEARKIAAMAEVYGIPIAPHGMASPLNMTAYGHLCATVPNLLALEWGPYFSTAYDHLMPRPTYNAGFMELPDAPGIGIELNQDVIKETLLPGYEFPAA
jgi:galactonate dehydratase